MENIIKFIVKNENFGRRIDNVLTNYLPKISRSKIKKYIEGKNLSINGKIIISSSKKVIGGDKVILKVPEEKKISIKPYKYKLEIVYEDNDLIIINKSSGISIHPGPGNYDNTIVNALINHYGTNLSNINGDFRPGIVHRIDKDTSGLIIVAKNNFSHLFLSNQFKNHSIKRKYVSLIWGKLRPSFGRIDTLITRSSKNRQLMEVSSSRGKRAVTNYKTIETFENNNIPTFSLVECELETGRTHQIRVHMSYMGNYILGDKQYKKNFKKLKNISKNLENSLLNLNRQFLHAKSIGFKHPSTDKYMEFESNLPLNLAKILKKLRKTT